MHLPIIRTSFSVICTLCRWLKDELSIQVDMDSIRASFEEKMKKKEGKEKGGGGGNQSRKNRGDVSISP